ncbi:MAG: hypothetical protein F4X20_04865 [Dehalococcoidia bacterium]|nr:hypothetical protein [Dehalococcoidia bacterium]
MDLDTRAEAAKDLSGKTGHTGRQRTVTMPSLIPFGDGTRTEIKVAAPDASVTPSRGPNVRQFRETAAILAKEAGTNVAVPHS